VQSTKDRTLALALAQRLRPSQTERWQPKPQKSNKMAAEAAEDEASLLSIA